MAGGNSASTRKPVRLAPEPDLKRGLMWAAGSKLDDRVVLMAVASSIKYTAHAFVPSDAWSAESRRLRVLLAASTEPWGWERAPDDSTFLGIQGGALTF